MLCCVEGCYGAQACTGVINPAFLCKFSTAGNGSRLPRCTQLTGLINTSAKRRTARLHTEKVKRWEITSGDKDWRALPSSLKNSRETFSTVPTNTPKPTTAVKDKGAVTLSGLRIRKHAAALCLWNRFQKQNTFNNISAVFEVKIL